MKVDSRTDIVSLTDFSRNTRKHCDEVQISGQPRVLTHNGTATAVVLSVEAYEAMAADAEEHRLNRELQKALQAYEEGERGEPFETVFERIRSNRQDRPSA